jgi:SNF2 family DNA or RNA helicase
LELIADYARLKFGPGSYELTDTSTPAAERYAAVQRFNAASSAAPQPQQDTDMPAADAAAGSEAAGTSSDSAAQAKQPFVFLMTPRSIGLGTELPGLSAAIIFESDWHPRLDLQALHR